jgi:hypothetical protein
VPRATAAILAALAALAVVAASLARADFGQDEKKFDNAAYPAEFRAKVNQAVLDAATWILSQQADDGSWKTERDGQYPVGATALCTLALLKAGIPAGHPRIEKAFTVLKSRKAEHTYEVAILLMALDAKYDPAPDGFAEEQVDRYGNRAVFSPCGQNASKEDLAWMKELVDFLVKNQQDGHWRYPSGGFDLSNTQYALLGLKAASRCGVKVPTSAWTDALEFLLAYQVPDGPEVAFRANEVRGEYRVEWSERAKARGFGYVEKSPATGSMTTAGAAGLMICQSELWKSRKFTGEMRARTRVGVRDALAWMQANFAVDHNPGLPFSGPWHFYYLYGLERMGILSHSRFLGPIDWYKSGADLLLQWQKKDGHWEENEADKAGGRFLVDTCFGLLFLKRGTFRTANPVITRSEPDVPPAAPAPQAPAPVPGK